MNQKALPKRPSLHALMEEGIKSAAESFALIAGTDIKAKPGQLFLVQNNVKLNSCVPKDKYLYLLTTSLMGHLPGASYLLFNQDDIDVMAKFPAFKSMKNPDNSEHRMFTEMLLKELDNILSAKVITQLSNQLEIKILGDVPLFERKSALETNEIIDNYLPHEFKSFLYKTTFSHESYPDFAPKFIWKFSVIIMNDIEIPTYPTVSKLILSSLFEIGIQSPNPKH